MPEVVIVGGVRTPFVKAAGVFNDIPAQELGRLVVREILYRHAIDPSEVDEVIVGNVATPPEAANVARVIALRAGIPQDRIAHTVSRNCASGMESITEAAEIIQSGRSRCVVAVGVDSMSNIPIFFRKQLKEKLWRLHRSRGVLKKLRAISKFRPADLSPEIGLKLGLTDPVTGLLMGETAEKLAREYGISREEQDAFALRSHQRATQAWEDNRLDDEVMTVYPDSKFGPVSQDDGMRADQNLKALGRLRPFFDRRWGSVTVGNACQVSDGAVAFLLMEKERATSLGLNPAGRIVSYAYAGCDPTRMGLGPVFASRRALNSADLSLADVDLIELNEAFSAQVLACLKAFETGTCVGNGSDSLAKPLGVIDQEKLNVNGGAIALGHPVGATGARLVLTVLSELKRRNQRLGLATLCVGGGQGATVIVENLQKAV